MKTLYLDCGMGAAGDMLTAALLELFENKEEVVEKLNALHVPGVTYTAEHVSKCGIGATHMHVMVNGEEEGEHMHHHHHDHDHEHHHHHSGMHEISHIVEHLSVDEKVRKDIMAVFGMIAEAESTVHGMPVDEIHFHEVGTMDAVADVAAVCYLMHQLDVDEVIATPVNTGSGHVHCAHGILPVPAPATALLLKDIPIFNNNIQMELCTPTGAALLKYFVNRFGNMPVMKVHAIGYGAGMKDLEAANVVRAVLGETESAAEEVIELQCNVDDMTAEAVSFAMEQFFAHGAREVYTVSAGMKKSRPGLLLCVMCMEKDRDAMLELIFRHTTTIGVREHRTKRYTLKRTMESLDTPYGVVRRKVSEGFGTRREKLEYEDLARIAREKNVSLSEVAALIKEDGGCKPQED